MFFKPHKIFENKLSEQISNDNPYKQKLIQMETPTDKHPIYSTLVFSLLIYGWLFFFTLFYKLFYVTKISETNFLYIIISAINIIFVTIAIMLTYKKNFCEPQNVKSEIISHIIFVSVFFLSIINGVADSGTASWNEILTSFCFWEHINKKSYIALAIVLYTALGVSIGHFSNEYILYQNYYSIHKNCPEFKSENALINRCIFFVFVFIVVYPHALKKSFNPSEDNYDFFIKNISIYFMCYCIPVAISCIFAKKYIYTFNQAIKFEKEKNNDRY